MTRPATGPLWKYRMSRLFLGGAWSVCVVLAALSAWAGPYGQSAHGDLATGVARTGLASPGPYVTGNCAHCHEQHASMGGIEPQPTNSGPSSFALFAPGFDSSRRFKPYQMEDVVCFYCHTSTASYQAPGGVLLNYDYANAFAGYTGGPTSILEAFNQSLAGVDASYHNLYDIWRYAPRFSYFKSTSSPCDACHNPHRARRNRAWPQDPSYTAISRPTEHESLWGDDPGERMSAYGGSYQPPLYFASRITYEPGGLGEVGADGSKTPDYNKFCNDCHGVRLPSTTLMRDAVAIEWEIGGGDSASAGDKHGANGYTGAIFMKKPYDETVIPAGGYLLACLDCHEAHGSPNAFLVRRAVNGEVLGGTFAQDKTGKSWAFLCGRCHQDDYQRGGSTDLNQVNRWRTVHHGGGSADIAYQVQGGTCGTCHELSPGPQPIGCGNCHFHGSYCDSTHPGTLANGKTIPAPIGGVRRTF